MVAPTVDPTTRNGIVYVDLGATSEVKAGMYARGEFDIGASDALTLPQSAVVLRDGFSYVLKVGADSKVTQAKVGVGRRVGERIEITSGLARRRQGGERGRRLPERRRHGARGRGRPKPVAAAKYQVDDEEEQRHVQRLLLVDQATRRRRSCSSSCSRWRACWASRR